MARVLPTPGSGSSGSHAVTASKDVQIEFASKASKALTQIRRLLDKVKNDAMVERVIAGEQFYLPSYFVEKHGVIGWLSNQLIDRLIDWLIDLSISDFYFQRLAI